MAKIKMRFTELSMAGIQSTYTSGTLHVFLLPLGDKYHVYTSPVHVPVFSLFHSQNPQQAYAVPVRLEEDGSTFLEMDHTLDLLEAHAGDAMEGFTLRHVESTASGWELDIPGHNFFTDDTVKIGGSGIFRVVGRSETHVHVQKEHVSGTGIERARKRVFGCIHDAFFFSSVWITL